MGYQARKELFQKWPGKVAERLLAHAKYIIKNVGKMKRAQTRGDAKAKEEIYSFDDDSYIWRSRGAHLTLAEKANNGKRKSRSKKLGSQNSVSSAGSVSVSSDWVRNMNAAERVAELQSLREQLGVEEEHTNRWAKDLKPLS